MLVRLAVPGVLDMSLGQAKSCQDKRGASHSKHTMPENATEHVSSLISFDCGLSGAASDDSFQAGANLQDMDMRTLSQILSAVRARCFIIEAQLEELKSQLGPILGESWSHYLVALRLTRPHSGPSQED